MEGDKKLCPDMDSGCGAPWRAGSHFFPGSPVRDTFYQHQGLMAALVGFQTALRKMTKELVIYAISIYCDSTLFISSFLALF